MKIRKAQMTATGEEEEGGYFERLPDDVIIDIFNRVNDCKFLTQCLLVSKRIASLMRLVSSVFINIHLGQVKQNPSQSDNRNRVWLHYKIISPSSQPADSWLNGSLLENLANLCNCKTREALHHFRKVKSVIVLNKSFRMDTVSWLMEYSGGGVNIIKNGAFLTPVHDNPLGSHMINFWVASLFRLAFTFLPMMSHMVHDHESLRDILVTTPFRKGLIHVAEDEIVKMRQAGRSTDKIMMGEKVHMKVKVWYIPVPNTRIYYVFVVVIGGSDNIDREVNAITGRFWSDSSYWVGHHEDVIQEAGIERKLRELVEMKPCNFEYVWEGNIINVI